MLSARPLIILSFLGGGAFRPASVQGQASSSAQELAVAARAAIDAGKFVEGFRLGIELLDSFPEATWSRDELRGHVAMVGDLLFREMTPIQQQAAIAAIIKPPTKPSARFALAYAKWMAGDRVTTRQEGLSIINDHPESVGAGCTMEKYFFALYYDRDEPQSYALVQQFAKIAADNPSIEWVLCQFTWWQFRWGKAQGLKNSLSQIISLVPGSRAADTATELKRLIEDIESSRYAKAFDRMDALRPHLVESAVIDVVNTFLYGTTRPGMSERVPALRTAAQDIINSQRGAGDRAFALCVLAQLKLHAGRIGAVKLYLDQAEQLGPTWVEDYVLSRLGRVCAQDEPLKAIDLLERYKARYGHTPGSPRNVDRLGRTYLSRGQFSDGLATFEFLEDRRERGQFVASGMEYRPRIGAMRCLEGLGREAEADALATELLGDAAYQAADLTSLSKHALEAAYASLEILERADEAAAVKAELDSR